MAETDWPVFLYEKLSTFSPLLSLLPQPQPDKSIFGAGVLESAPDKKPFIVIHIDSEVPNPSFPGHSLTRATIYAHGEQGDYMVQADLLRQVRAALAPNATGTAHAQGLCRWAGNSGDLSDEIMRTLVRTSTFELYGRDGQL